MNFRTTLFPVAALALAALLPACQQSLAYINIPADQGDVAINDANGSNVAHLEAISLKAVRDGASEKRVVTVLLPAGTRYATYQKVVALAGDGFVLPEAAPAGTPVYEVRAIHTRSADGRVDVVTPGEIRPLALTEVNLEFRAEIDGLSWRVTYLEPRRILPSAADHQAPKPEVKPAPETNPEAGQAEAKAETQARPEAQEAPQAKPPVETKTEPKAESEAKPAPEAESKPAAEQPKPVKAKFEA